MRRAVCCCKAMNSLYWELPTVETLRAARKFSAVVLESPYTWFLSSSLDNPTSIHKSGSKSGWVEGSSHISPSTGYYRSPENEKRNHHIQFNKNNNLQNKMVEWTYHKVLSAVVNELLHPLLTILTPHMHLNKQLHWARLTSKRRSL